MVGSSSDKPDCYKCKWRRNCPGDAHSQCVHPKNKEALDDPFMEVMSIFASVGRVSPVIGGGVNVKGNIYGIRSGWFNYPFNFDPIWLEECDGFEEKDKDKEE